MITTGTIEERLQSLVGAERFRPATAEDSVSGAQPQFVVEPADEQQLAAVLSWANEAGLAVIPRGGGTKLAWGNPPKRADLILSTAALNRIREHAWADLTVTVEAGCTIQTLQRTLAQHGQRLALDPLWPERATIGGVLSTNDSGALRLRFGALRDLIIGLTLALPDGTIASSGGKVVKNVAGYDLPKLLTGAFGTLGVITRAVFRLHPLGRTVRTVSCLTAQRPEAERIVAQLLASKLAFSAVQTRLNGSKTGSEEPGISVDILFEGTAEGVVAQVEHVQSLAAPLTITESDESVWRAREELHSAALGDAAGSALLKMSALPADAIRMVGELVVTAAAGAKVDAVVQATGLGTILLRGDERQLRPIIESFRKTVEAAGGTVVILGNAAAARNLDPWGATGDALPLMRAVKAQLDPRNTLNPGRFVGGI